MTVLVMSTFVAVGILVAALALYLVLIAFILGKVRDHAGLIVFGVRAIADQVTPVKPVLGEINADLSGVRDVLRELLERHGEPGKPEEATAQPDIVGPNQDRTPGIEASETVSSGAPGSPGPEGWTDHA